MGFVHSQFLIGVNELINKRINVYYHELIPMQNLNSYSFKATSKTLPNGDILVESNYGFSDCFLRDDTVPYKNGTKLEWTLRKFESLTKWLAGDEAKKRYKTSTIYSPSLPTETMTVIVNDMYDEIMRITNHDVEVAYRLVPMLLSNNFQAIAVMLDIAKTATNDEVRKYIELIQKTEDMKLAISDYQLLFDTMDKN